MLVYDKMYFLIILFPMNSSGLTQLLNTDQRKLTALQQREMEQVYQHLKRIAKSQKFKIKNSGINTTALVNEAWLNTKGGKKLFNDRNHFFAYCSIAMRHILIQKARANKLVIFVDDDKLLHNQAVFKQSDYLLELERQLKKLKEFSPRLEQIFTYKFYGDMDFDSIAKVMDMSERTIFRDWKKARAMLSVAMQE